LPGHPPRRELNSASSTADPLQRTEYDGSGCVRTSCLLCLSVMSDLLDLTHPTAPHESYEMPRHTRARAHRAAAWASEFTGAPDSSRTVIADSLEAAQGELTELLHTTHSLAETAYDEHDSVAEIASVLGARGIDVDTGLYGVETTLRATTGSGNGRTIAVLAEYDALPEIGHACGHNIIATAGVGAFLALHALYEADPDSVPGTVVLLGTPAEEGHSGKEVMARAG